MRIPRPNTGPLAALALLLVAGAAHAASTNKTIGVNVLLKSDPDAAALAQLAQYGKVRDVVIEIDAVTLQTTESNLEAIRALPIVATANPDAKRDGAPVDTVAATNFANGLSTWDQDSIDVTNFGVAGRTVPYDGSGVYVAVIDTGLLDSWRQYFPQERIATQFGQSFRGGGGEIGNVSEPPNVWEHDQNSHGTHVTSTILGYSLGGVAINGTAPRATVIPVKVLNQNGSAWSSVVARGIVYVTDLKNGGALGTAPVVINMSLGGPSLDAMEQAAVDYAVASGVVVVASAGNSGTGGMGYPGAYAPVISVAASGWNGQWSSPTWWFSTDVPDPTSATDFYIAGFSSREKPGQDLDVAAPGSWVVGPYQLQSANTSYFYLSGTSMASPHVAGIAALMLQKNPSLTGPQVETILEASAIPFLGPFPMCASVPQPSGPAQNTCWDVDAFGAGLATATAALAATP